MRFEAIAAFAIGTLLPVLGLQPAAAGAIISRRAGNLAVRPLTAHADKT